MNMRVCPFDGINLCAVVHSTGYFHPYGNIVNKYLHILGIPRYILKIDYIFTLYVPCNDME